MSVDWKSLDEILDTILYQMEKEWHERKVVSHEEKIGRQNEGQR